MTGQRPTGDKIEGGASLDGSMLASFGFTSALGGCTLCRVGRCCSAVNTEPTTGDLLDARTTHFPVVLVRRFHARSQRKRKRARIGDPRAGLPTSVDPVLLTTTSVDFRLFLAHVNLLGLPLHWQLPNAGNTLGLGSTADLWLLRQTTFRIHLK